MTANEWRFKMCVLARDEWRKNFDEYPGLCYLFRKVIFDNGRKVTDDENLNSEINYFFWCCRCDDTVSGFPVKKLIPAFRRPPEANQRTAFWWPEDKKYVRLEFLNELVNIYANLIDKEN